MQRHRCCTEEWPACPRRINAPLPNLIFFAAKWNGSVCCSRLDNEEWFRLPQQRSASESILLCRKVEWFRLQQSSRQRRIARLPQSFGVQAGTGCHEGGIILSKKPPEWRLSLPYQRSASEANIRRVNEGSLCRSENESRRKTMRFSSYLIPEHSSVF